MSKELMTTDNSNLMLMPAASLLVIKEVYQAKKDFIGSILREGVDYGTIPGSAKPALYKPGAEKMSSFFNLAPSFEDIEKVEDWTGENHGGEPFFYYRIRCHMFVGDRRIASADGSCNSMETKYRYRWVGDSDIPAGLEKTKLKTAGGRISEFTFAVDKSETGGKYGKPAAYWQSFKDAIANGQARSIKKKIKSGEERDAWEIDSTLYRVPNNEISDLVNTILKMAQKRALVAVTLIATGTSEYFTQDIDDFIDPISHPEIVEKVIDAEFKPEQSPAPVSDPEPEPVTKPEPEKKAMRPLSPETLAQMLTNKARTYGNIEVNEKQIGLAASMIETCFAGQEHADKIRHSIVKYLTGYASLKECSGAEIKAMLDWLKPVKDSGGEYRPDAMAQKEIQGVWTAALKEAGQEELPL